MNWKLFWRGLRLLFLLRAPLATLVLVAALGPLALRTSFSSLLGNLLDQSESGWGTFLVSMGAFLLAYAAVTTLNLIVYYGSDRFPDSDVFPLAQKRPLVTFLAGTLSAILLVACVVIRTEAPKAPHLLAAVLGLSAALALVFISKVLQLKATDPKTTRHPPPYLVFPADRVRIFGSYFLRDYFDRLYCQYPERMKTRKQRFNRLSQWPLEIIRRTGQGYLIDTCAPAGQLKLRSGHVFALALSLIAFGLYLVVGFNKGFITAGPARVPALAFVLLFLNVACWSLGALTFFFDRYRFPLLWTIAGLAALTASAPESDHFFRVQTGIARPLFLSPAAYLRERITAGQRGGKVDLVFVATPGGGIQAAAWTAQVLERMNDRMNTKIDVKDQFRSSISFISSVSGGSLGSLIYAASIANLVDHPAENARASAIDEVAWGWTQPDVRRAVLPWFGSRTVDRGWALEEKWIAVNNLGTPRLGPIDRLFAKRAEGHDVFLSDWARMGARLPALVFNSMLVERGQHVVFSTTDYPVKNDARSVVNFYSLYPGDRFDIRVATAARLSASFPYVAPASRPEIDPYATGFHFVDGGYFDNYGIDSLIGWLREALDGVEIGDILILQIRHFNPDDVPAAGRRGWLYQTYAPLSGLLSMWNAAPASRDRNELGLFLNGFESAKHHVWLSTVKFRAQAGACAPLSWKLSPGERNCIDTAWQKLDADWNKLEQHQAEAANDSQSYDWTFECVRRYLTRRAGDMPPSVCRVQP